jgi:hypothetical protein
VGVWITRLFEFKIRHNIYYQHNKAIESTSPPPGGG